MWKYLHEHFLSKGHSGLIKDVEIIFIKTDTSGPTRRKEFWRIMRKNIALYGLNMEELPFISSLW